MKSKHKYTKGLVGQFTLYPQKKKIQMYRLDREYWIRECDHIRWKKWLIQENQLAEKKNTKTHWDKTKVIEIPAKFFK